MNSNDYDTEATSLDGCRGILSFNSSLVRLGALYKWIISKYANEFQFQLGAIGRRQKEANDIASKAVSIPAWCDWECDEKL